VVAFGHERLRASLARLTRAPISIRVGAPLHLPEVRGAPDLAGNTDRIMRAMAALLPWEYRGVYATGAASATTAPIGAGGDEFADATDKQMAER
jgi:hypothetical protein